MCVCSMIAPCPSLTNACLKKTRSMFRFAPHCGIRAEYIMLKFILAGPLLERRCISWRETCHNRVVSVQTYPSFKLLSLAASPWPKVLYPNSEQYRPYANLTAQRTYSILLEPVLSIINNQYYSCCSLAVCRPAGTPDSRINMNLPTYYVASQSNKRLFTS